jgi:hypothetical protein
VRLDGPRTWVTDQPTPTVSGRVLGAAPERLILYVNGAPTDVNLAQRSFEASVPLRPGANELRAVVTGPAGLEAEDTITVEYFPRPSSKGIVLTSPPDGLTLGPDDPPVAVVEGEIDDKAAATVWIVANDRRISVAASGGRFGILLLLIRWSTCGRRHLTETPSTGARRDRPDGRRATLGSLVMQWPTGTEESVSGERHLARASGLDVPVQACGCRRSKTPGAPPACSPSGAGRSTP